MPKVLETSLEYPAVGARFKATRQKVVQRIKYLLDAIEKEGRALSEHESLCIRQSIKALQVHAYRQSADSILFAERPDLYADTLVVPPDPGVLSIAELRGRLRSALHGGRVQA